MTVSITLKPFHLQYCSKTQKGTKHLLSGQGLPLWFQEPSSTLYRILLSETILLDVVNRSRLLQCKRVEFVNYVTACVSESRPT
jgi:hypothetical protein